MENTPTALFESYEHDFKSLSGSIQQKLDKDVGAQKGEQRKATLRAVEREIDEADELLSQMEVEIQGMPQSIKSKYQNRARVLKTDLQRWKKQSRELHLATSRAEILSSGKNPAGSDDPYVSDDVQGQRTRLLQGNQSLQDSTRRLEDSQRIALETEDIGAGILRNLQGQRETIVRSIDQLGQADSSIDRSSTTLKGMIRRMYQQKVMTAGIIIVLVFLILIILYEKLF